MKTRGAGTLVRVERVKRGWTQLDLAVNAGLAMNTVSLCERSGRITVPVAKKLAKALGVKVATFMPENANARAEHRASAA